uniref:Pollen-specific leucine-rich repeat extensin-like protein 1 n=1 Tax=Bursaphelenchus xylophilus TaxID=6326 RepID=A0A1I7SA55_BURXY
MLRLIALSLLLLTVQGQEEARRVLYGLPPLPDDPTTTHAPPPSIRPRIFRFGPLIHPVIHHPPIPPPAPPHHHPLHLALPALGNPFDNYYNINPIPELPPRPENKLNGFYDLDGNFVPYGNEANLQSESSGHSRPKRAPMTEEDLRRRLLEEEYAYDDELSEPKIQNVGTTRIPSKSAAKNGKQLQRARHMVSHDTENPTPSKANLAPKRPRKQGVINHNPTTTTKKPVSVHPRFIPHPPKARRPSQKPKQVLTPAYQQQNQQQVQPAFYPSNQYSQARSLQRLNMIFWGCLEVPRIHYFLDLGKF